MRQTPFWLGLGAIVALALSPPATAQDVVKIGVVTDHTGNSAEFARIEEQGLELALKEINASGGILGKQVQLLYEDDEDKPALSATKIRKLSSAGVPAIIQLSSSTSTQQADYARDPVVSGDGRYVAFDGSFDGLSGIWRRDLQTGQLRPVAVGRQLRGGRSGCSTTLSWEQADCDAELPSISEDGQYVSFTTSAPLAPKEDTNSAPDVYVRNMNLEASESESRSCGTAEEEDAPELTQRCAYTLASAVNGVDQGLTYERSAGLGSVAGGRSAMSANGQEVAFVTTAVSDLQPYYTPVLREVLFQTAS